MTRGTNHMLAIRLTCTEDERQESYAERRSAMAVNGIDLRSVSRHTGIPLGTLGRWASEGRWPIVGRDPANRRWKLYDVFAVSAAVTARQDRESEAAA